MQKSVPDGFIEHAVYSNSQGENDQNGLEEASCNEAFESKVQAETDFDQAFSSHKDVLEKLR